ncbi:tRNA-splicing endonuclease subunit Sen2 [Penicillium macrosclerotiorum]|uniref:tRNA-splicing endonuclease subunit Sen2 n=1 Tax=Penicillium macrosclerotiorum TaxID=303699 RepID=UPI0025484344|nr:tRNA-splicing endonuclease subunit Sen2 [Penicillium macrosclerotiorum]KAJ5689369.1 tRNA-splicing endonuclease subunit Sen2 [Penicillium macrosclerotiorum]
MTEVVSATVSEAGPAQAKSRPAPARSSRPNYRHIHRFPLPVNVHPIPAVIPHNPLSIISAVLSYLTFLITPPRQETYTAYFDSATSSVHVTDEKVIRALWEMGFFGKGSLSRSEPSWLEREKKRRGLLGGLPMRRL